MSSQHRAQACDLPVLRAAAKLLLTLATVPAMTTGQ
jgi:hypothetical protein